MYRLERRREGVFIRICAVGTVSRYSAPLTLLFCLNSRRSRLEGMPAICMTRMDG